MLLTEYDEKTAMELFKEEGRAEGREEGIQGIVALCQKVGYSITDAMENVITTFRLDESTSRAMVLKYWK